MTVEVPVWLFFVICLFIYINFWMTMDMARKLKANDLQIVVNSKIVNQSFEDIAQDMNQLTKVIDKLEARYDYEKSKVKVSN